jgi:hypothetical protein
MQHVQVQKGNAQKDFECRLKWKETVQSIGLSCPCSQKTKDSGMWAVENFSGSSSLSIRSNVLQHEKSSVSGTSDGCHSFKRIDISIGR